MRPILQNALGAGGEERRLALDDITVTGPGGRIVDEREDAVRYPTMKIHLTEKAPRRRPQVAGKQIPQERIQSIEIGEEQGDSFIDPSMFSPSDPFPPVG